VNSMREALLRHLVALVITVVAGAMLSATMLRLAPGFDVDESQLDSRMSAETHHSMVAERVSQKNLLTFYVRYARGAVHGDFGRSLLFNRPVRELIAERTMPTLRTAGSGLLLGMLAAFGLALIELTLRRRFVRMAGVVIAAGLISLPSAVIALFFVTWNQPAAIAIALIVFPRLYSYISRPLAECSRLPHVLAARARGISPVRIAFRHVVPVVGRHLLALAGVSVALAFGAAIPVESFCGIPGLGQLAWQSALGRDLPLLVTISVFTVFIILLATSTSDLLSEALGLPRL
jgi:peptide/nickel transport system permease protein